jgi:hypothetical protein
VLKDGRVFGTGAWTRSRPPYPTPDNARGRHMNATDGQVIHGVECYEAWRDYEDCPHELAHEERQP